MPAGIANDGASMSKKIRKGLRALIQEREPDPEVLSVLGRIALGPLNSPATDRTLAIVGAVYIEDELRNAIKKHFLPGHSAETENQVFSDEQAPLSGLAARARIAFALGIISAELLGDITLVRDIRNAFAHTSASVSFGTKAVKDAVTALTIVPDVSKKGLFKRRSERFVLRTKFIMAIAIICKILQAMRPYWLIVPPSKSALAEAVLATSRRPKQSQ